LVIKQYNDAVEALIYMIITDAV